MTSVHTSRGRCGGTLGEAGYSLVELLVSTTIMLVITGSIFTLVNPSQHTFKAQPEVSDMQQRMRVASDMLFKDLLMAGAGPYQGAVTGSLMNYFAPVLPYRSGATSSDPGSGIYYRPDAITLVYVPNTAAQTTITSKMPNVSAELKVAAQKNCPAGKQLCGFEEGMSLLIFDTDGSWDSFAVTQVQDAAAHLQHRGQQFTKEYLPGAQVVQAEYHTYYYCGLAACPGGASNQLRHYDGLSTDLPLVDNVVDVRFRYYGDPNPPTAPTPQTIGAANCVIDASGDPILPTLGATDGSLVELTQAMLTDGPWCPSAASPSRFDADLLRLRKVRVSLRVQASDADLRGTSTTLFRNAGTAKTGQRFVPDYSSMFEISPRNLNLTR